LAQIWPVWVAVLCVLGTLSPTLIELVRYWITIDNYNYGFLIALICCVWIPLAVRTGIGAGIQPTVWLVMPLAVCLLAWYAFWSGNSMQGAQLLVPVALWLVLAALLGLRVAQALLIPVGYFYFAIPIWDAFLPLMQDIAVFGAKYSMALAGVPYTVSGVNIVIPEGTFEVTTDCSGLRYLVVSMALAVLFGVLERMRLRRLAGFVALAGAMAIAANWIRIFIVMYAGHLTKMEHYFVAESHLGLGNVIFGVLLVVIFVVGRRLIGDASTATAAPDIKPQRSIGIHATLAAVIAVCVITGGLSMRASAQTEIAFNPQLAPLPASISRWLGPMPGIAHLWMPKYVDALDQRRVTYRSSEGGGTVDVELYMNVYGVQKQGHELVFYQHSVAGPGVWQKVQSHRSVTHSGSVLRIDEYRDPSGTKWLIGQTYVLGGRPSLGALQIQLLYGLSTLTKPRPAGLIATAIRCQSDCQPAHAQLSEFWRAMAAPLVATFPTRMPPPL
jgi:exosortase